MECLEWLGSFKRTYNPKLRDLIRIKNNSRLGSDNALYGSDLPEKLVTIYLEGKEASALLRRTIERKHLYIFSQNLLHLHQNQKIKCWQFYEKNNLMF